MADTDKKSVQAQETTKQKIKSAALSQFSKMGLAATRIQDIAGAAGISQGLLYRYYTSKDEIYFELINEALDKINEASINARDMALGAAEKIALAFTMLFKAIETSENFRQTCRLITQAMNTAAFDENAQRLLDEKRDISYTTFAGIFAQGQADGAVVDGDPKELSVLFWSMINGLAIYYATRTTTAPLPDPKRAAGMFLK